jgi:hypothetical protein
VQGANRGKTDEILQHAEQCNDHKMGGYTRAVSGQQLDKHVPTAKQQILNNSTAGL